jgi:hypothetical protein
MSESRVNSAAIPKTKKLSFFRLVLLSEAQSIEYTCQATPPPQKKTTTKPLKSIILLHKMVLLYYPRKEATYKSNPKNEHMSL